MRIARYGYREPVTIHDIQRVGNCLLCIISIGYYSRYGQIDHDIKHDMQEAGKELEDRGEALGLMEPMLIAEGARAREELLEESWRDYVSSPALARGVELSFKPVRDSRSPEIGLNRNDG